MLANTRPVLHLFKRFLSTTQVVRMDKTGIVPDVIDKLPEKLVKV